jgi:hypothetical protein
MMQPSFPTAAFCRGAWITSFAFGIRMVRRYPRRCAGTEIP